MALFGVVGFVATTAVTFVYALSMWELVSAQTRCDCSFASFDTQPAVIARTLAVLLLSMARSLAELHAAQRLLSPDPRGRRRGISVYIAVAAVHCIVTPMWVGGLGGVGFVLLAGWPVVVAVGFARASSASSTVQRCVGSIELPRAYVRR